jgi:hypothetical protein
LLTNNSVLQQAEAERQAAEAQRQQEQNVLRNDVQVS